MALLDATLALIQAEYKKPEVAWRSAPINAKELAFLERECTKIVEFDPKGWRKEMFQRGGRMEVRECDYGRVVVLYDNDDQTVPWGLWGRILRLYGVSACIYFLAHPALRQFPASKKAIGPIHINGGYNYPCNVEEVMIYRAEDATRVLLHELQHANCLDNHDHGTDALEAETEAWAELLYAGVLSQGKRAVFLQLVQEQAAWFIAQNEQVKQHMKSPTQFPYRYTIAKEAVWRRWGLVKDLRTATSLRLQAGTASQSLRLTAHTSGAASPQHSLRLTPPPSAALKRVFGVSPDSTIL